MTPIADDRSGSGTDDGARVEVSPRPDCVVVTVSGDVDLTSAPKLASVLQTAATAHRRPVLVVDMTDLTFIDSTGLGVLINTHNRAKVLGESIVLVHPPPLVQRLLAGTQLQRLFSAYDTLDEALSAVRTV